MTSVVYAIMRCRQILSRHRKFEVYTTHFPLTVYFGIGIDEIDRPRVRFCRELIRQYRFDVLHVSTVPDSGENRRRHQEGEEALTAIARAVTVEYPKTEAQPEAVNAIEVPAPAIEAQPVPGIFPSGTHDSCQRLVVRITPGTGTKCAQVRRKIT